MAIVGITRVKRNPMWMLLISYGHIISETLVVEMKIFATFEEIKKMVEINPLVHISREKLKYDFRAERNRVEGVLTYPFTAPLRTALVLCV